MPHTQNIYFGCGKKATLNNLLYEVTGVVIKKTSDNYFWTEYALYNKAAGWLYLNEYNEHWTLLNEISPNDYYHKCYVEQGTLWGNKYKLFSDDKDCSIAWATGLFGYQLPTDTFAIKDSIAPPLLISLEEVEGKISTFAGRYVTHKEMNATFTDIIFASPIGIGMARPALFNMPSFLALMSIFVLFTSLSSALIYAYQVAPDIYTYRAKPLVSVEWHPQLNDVEQPSASFTINRKLPTALDISLFADVTNNWISVDVGLVNEKTNEVRYAWHDIEYYGGTDDGEYWSEGNQRSTITFCNVQSGSYHLVLLANKLDYSVQNRVVVSATLVNYSVSNILSALGVLILLMLVAMAIYHLFEAVRWSTSEFTPYKDWDE